MSWVGDRDGERLLTTLVEMECCSGRAGDRLIEGGRAGVRKET